MGHGGGQNGGSLGQVELASKEGVEPNFQIRFFVQF